MLHRKLSTSAGFYCLEEDREIDQELIAYLEKKPLLFGGDLLSSPTCSLQSLIMSQTKIRASHFGGRLFKSAATSALALSALAGGGDVVWW